jgi:DNA repair ATPase RecN
MFKTFFKVGTGLVILTGAAIGGALLIAGPGRTAAVIGQMHGEVMQIIDDNVDDPVALRAQLRDLEAEFPGRISQVREDLSETREQIHQLHREQAICERVVEMARGDLGGLQPLVNEATALRVSSGNPRIAVVSWDDRVYSYDRARSQITQMEQTILSYTNRAADATHDLAYLEQQELRLSELLTQLENERAEFQSQILQLSRQVDAIARNERLIEMIEKRKRTIEECSRYDVISLDQITSRLASKRAEQEAELDMLANSQRGMDYEEMARVDIGRETVDGHGPAPLPLPLHTNAVSNN